MVLTAMPLMFMHFVLSQTKFWQYTCAIGGIVYTARFAAGAAYAGEPMLLDSIAAVVIGGPSLFGGTGTVIGTLIGALIIAVIEFGLVFIDVNAFGQFIVVGIVIIVSVLIDQYKERLGARNERYGRDAGARISWTSPTAALGAPEQRKMMALIGMPKMQRVAIVLISHNSHDIFAVSDRIVV
ncbi:hypothetical protein PWP93_28445 [Paraburkholderia sp. A1RI-2L]|uniref:hypothetical protein n=1 Tax=Paraburkholderia sp. A1RI-2L TaxID=3028367 RepID=UPI003B7E689C